MTFVYPFDIIRRRQQVCSRCCAYLAHCCAYRPLPSSHTITPIHAIIQTHSGSKPLYPSVLNALYTIATKEGFQHGLYRGVTLNYIKTVPNVAIYMSLYDVIKHRLFVPATADTDR